ncbi:MAG TPA: caspase family protein [Devosia sp.]|nr:caspase family protein [Devosia sp.]
MVFSHTHLHRRMRVLLAMAPVCFLGAMVTTPAQAENYALLVAATEYPNLAEKYWLKGPANDAILVHDYLVNSAPVKFAPDNVEVLATAPGLENPTHANILAGLQRIADEAKEGDFVYLHFSGHGTEQPAIDDITEPDGKDEVFLPSDTMMAPKGEKAMPNALTDNEIGDALAKIRDKGAFVWAIFDNCHSGTVTRGALNDEDLVERRIDPADLGIPPEAFPEPVDDETAERVAPMTAAEDEETTASKGGLVAFFAAQSTETTPEKNFPIDQPDGTTAQVKYGVFTYTIFSALAKNPGQTYRQLAQSVLQEYAARNTLKPTPLFEGQLDAPVFGTTAVASAQQWATTIDTADDTIGISAGQLHGLGKGTRLLLLPNPAATDDEALGLMEVTKVGPLRSTLEPVADDTHELIATADIPKGAFVRLAEQNYTYTLAVARPDPSQGNAEEVSRVNAALDAILAETQNPDNELALRMNLVDPGQPADLRLAVLSDSEVADLSNDPGERAAAADVTPALWLLPASGEISLKPATRTPALALDDSSLEDSFEETLAKNLVTVYRATGLSRLAAASTYKPTAFQLSIGVQKAGSGAVEDLDLENTPLVTQGDWLHIDLNNKSGKPMDLNVLYVDHSYAITQLCKVHLAAGDRLFAPLAGLNTSDVGSERIIAVINENPKDVTTDLAYLQQPAITRTRDVGDDTLMGMIAGLGAAEATRGPTPVATKTSTAPRAAVVMVPIEVAAAGADYQDPGTTPPDFTDARTGRNSCWDNE